MGGMIKGAGDMFTGIQQSEADRVANNAQLNLDMSAASAGAGTAETRGTAAQSRVLSEGGAMLAKQRVAYANAGVDASVGTAAAVQNDTAAKTQLDSQTAKNNAALEVWGFKHQEAQAVSDWQKKTTDSSNKTTGTVLGAAGEWVGGGASMAG